MNGIFLPIIVKVAIVRAHLNTPAVQSFALNRYPYYLVFILCPVITQSIAVLGRENNLSSTKSTQLLAALTAYMDGNTLQNSSDKYN